MKASLPVTGQTREKPDKYKKAGICRLFIDR